MTALLLNPTTKKHCLLLPSPPSALPPSGVGSVASPVKSPIIINAYIHAKRSGGMLSDFNPHANAATAAIV